MTATPLWRDNLDSRVTRDPYDVGMSSANCPNCGEPVVPILYGYPTGESMAKSESGEIALGGCIVGLDDPRRYCRSCKSSVWSHGVFSTNGELRVRLGSGSARFEASLPADGPLWISDASDIVVTIDRTDIELVALVCLVELFDDGTTLAGWLGYRRLRFRGEIVGPIDGFAFDAASDDNLPALESEGRVVAISGDQTLTIVGIYGRLVLHLLRDLTRQRHITSGEELLGWLTSIGLDVQATVSA